MPGPAEPAAAEFTVRLTATKAPGLTAVLHNGGAVERRVLKSPNLQPSRVVLKNAAAKEITPFDSRTRKKFDRTVRAAMFETVPPGGDLELADGEFEKQEDGTYFLRWGPFEYRQIPAGTWKARVVFESVIDAVTGGGSVSGVWKGKASSNEVAIQLP